MRTAFKSARSVPMFLFFRVAVSKDGKRVVAGGYDGTVKIWEINDIGEDKFIETI